LKYHRAHSFEAGKRLNFMQWIAPSEKDTAADTLEKRLWDAADQFRANSGLKPQEYSGPILGLIFLRFAEVRFAAQRAKLEKAGASARRASRIDDPAAYHAEGILYLPAEARFDYLLNRPEAENIGAKVNAAMRDVAKSELQSPNCEVQSVRQSKLDIRTSPIPASLDYDAFGRIYEYFLGEFAMSEGQGGGEFYTPSSIVRLLTEVIEPYHGRILETLRLATAQRERNGTKRAKPHCVLRKRRPCVLTSNGGRVEKGSQQLPGGIHRHG
jgi:type I restriction enzyme M protein